MRLEEHLTVNPLLCDELLGQVCMQLSVCLFVLLDYFSPPGKQSDIVPLMQNWQSCFENIAVE